MENYLYKSLMTKDLCYLDNIEIKLKVGLATYKLLRIETVENVEQGRK